MNLDEKFGKNDHTIPISAKSQDPEITHNDNSAAKSSDHSSAV